MPVTVASAGVGDEGRRGVHVSLAVAAGAGDEDPHEEAMHEMEQAWHLGQARKKEFREAMRTARGGKGAQGGGGSTERAAGRRVSLRGWRTGSRLLVRAAAVAWARGCPCGMTMH